MNTNFTTDIWDITCYGIRNFIFAIFYNKPYNIPNMSAEQKH